MKRLLLLVAFVLLPAASFAQSLAPDRDVLLTADGSLFTIESEYAGNFPNLQMQATQFLMLSVRNGETVKKTIVPDSTTEGLHRRPALAYDAESQTLFVFWLRSPNAMSSELLVASYQNGIWRAATSIDDKPLSYRFNLRIAVTHRVAQAQKDGSTTEVPLVIVHAVWWEMTGDGERARYVALPVDHGRLVLSDPREQLHDLSDFVPADAAHAAAEKMNPEILRHPALLDNGTASSIDVLFADTTTNNFSVTTLRPIMADGRLRIPVGIRHGAPPTRVPAPSNFTADWSGRIDTIANGRNGNSRFVIYNIGDNAVSYIVCADGKWSTINSLPVSEKFTADAAVTALSRMTNATE